MVECIEWGEDMKVLIGTPIKQEHEILHYFLTSLENLEKKDVTVDYCFVDDNDDELSKKLLAEFAAKHSVHLIPSDKNDEYIKTDETHVWKEKIVWNVAEFKNKIIRYAIEHDYDYLLFVDSDLILHKRTLLRLIECKKQIISEIFWTRWNQDSKLELPQVWVSDHYTIFEQRRDEILSEPEVNRRALQFIEKLKVPGVYEVGGLGALTLISREALLKGVNFNEIKNISFWGEDRHFCIRAAALGIPLHVDTCYPAFHIYRNEDLEKVKRGEIKL